MRRIPKSVHLDERPCLRVYRFEYFITNLNSEATIQNIVLAKRFQTTLVVYCDFSLYFNCRRNRRKTWQINYYRPDTQLAPLNVTRAFFNFFFIIIRLISVTFGISYNFPSSYSDVIHYQRMHCRLSLNHSPCCTHHDDGGVRCDFNHIIVDCPSLVSPRRNLCRILSINNISHTTDSHNILNSHSCNFSGF